MKLGLLSHAATAIRPSTLFDPNQFPELTDQNRYAQSRIPMEMIFQG